MCHGLCLIRTQKHRSAWHWLLKKALLDERSDQRGPTGTVSSSFSIYWRLFLMGAMCLTGPDASTAGPCCLTASRFCKRLHLDKASSGLIFAQLTSIT